MPTLKPRHMVTETTEIARALDAAAIVWPEVRDERAELLRRLITEGARAVEQRASQWRAERIDGILQAAGSVTGAWPARWRDELRDEWPL